MDFIFRWFAFQACSFHARRHHRVDQGALPRWVLLSPRHPRTTAHKIPVLPRYSGQNLSYQSLKGRRGVARAKGHPLPLVQLQFTCESGLFSVLLPQRDLPEGRNQVQCVEELGVAKFQEALIYSRYRVCIFFCHLVQVTKVATKPKLPSFFLAITTPQAQGDFEASIMSYSSNISISVRHASD